MIKNRQRFSVESLWAMQNIFKIQFAPVSRPQYEVL
jgi:hypothetical protein